MTTNSSFEKTQNDQVSVQTQPISTTRTNDSNNTTSQVKPTKKFVVGTDDGIEDNNTEVKETSPREALELSNDSKEMVENHRDTKARFYKPYPAEEVVKVVEERMAQQSQQSQQSQQNQQSDETSHEPATKIKESSSLPREKDNEVEKIVSTEQPNQQLQDKKNNIEIKEENNSNLIETDPRFAQSTITLPPSPPPPRPPTPPNNNINNKKFRPISSQLYTPPNEEIPDASPVNSKNFDIGIQADSYSISPPLLDDSYSSESLNYPHQPRFLPPINSISRTQQKLLLQRQHFLADDENYLIHPRNQLKLTKVIERINREHAAILLYRDPILESFQRAFTRYAQDHPEVLEDDFGAGYEDSKEWGILSEQGKDVDQLGSGANNAAGAEVLAAENLAFRGRN
ncbi:2500_t:CDS:1 [Diversispora eburnea]|uniref:2500_t:CDS:1 n=1 Tax=Diversispora eburnea TaxID=1213867 RepID=A0A9N8WPQ1_9GLOM|nr:2500_t:CDS:1 [Diversispora eburnea]